MTGQKEGRKDEEKGRKEGKIRENEKRAFASKKGKSDSFVLHAMCSLLIPIKPDHLFDTLSLTVCVCDRIKSSLLLQDPSLREDDGGGGGCVGGGGRRQARKRGSSGLGE